MSLWIGLSYKLTPRAKFVDFYGHLHSDVHQDYFNKFFAEFELNHSWKECQNLADLLSKQLILNMSTSKYYNANHFNLVKKRALCTQNTDINCVYQTSQYFQNDMLIQFVYINQWSRNYPGAQNYDGIGGDYVNVPERIPPGFFEKMGKKIDSNYSLY
jgi:hypothetical protein